MRAQELNCRIDREISKYKQGWSLSKAYHKVAVRLSPRVCIISNKGVLKT
jgi:hypothetical protein